MARQPFLTRLAFGRSPLQPSQPSNSSEQTAGYIQVSSSEEEQLEQDLREASNAQLNQSLEGSSQYVQRYNERGSPINPQAREYGRRLRQAQNDVLSAVGVVERRPPPSEGLPGAYDKRLEQLENEDTAANVIAILFTLAADQCTWWLGSVRDRILTYQIPDYISFTEILTLESQASGPGIAYAGFPARLASIVCYQACVYAAHVLRPLDRLFYNASPSRKVRLAFYRWRYIPKACFRILVEFALYPLSYHSSLQRLGLLPAKPMLPPWKSFLPLSPWSPIRLPVLRPGLSGAVLDISKAAITSPLFFVCIQHFAERYVYAVIHEVIETTIYRPTNPDLLSPDDGVKTAATAILGLRPKSPPLIRNTLNRVLSALGWGDRFGSPQESDPNTEADMRHRIQVGSQSVTNISQLQIAPVQSGTQPTSGHIGTVDAPVPVPRGPIENEPNPHPPPSPTSSERSQNGDHPTIRITNRGRIVEMEVRFPPQQLSSRREIVASAPLNVAPTQGVPRQHRVTQLSTEPAHALGALCKAQLVGWAVLPIRIIALRLIASHYVNRSSTTHSLSRVLDPFTDLRSLSFRSAGLWISRIALCGALDAVIASCLWGCEFLAVSYVGKKFFNWGKL